MSIPDGFPWNILSPWNAHLLISCLSSDKRLGVIRPQRIKIAADKQTEYDAEDPMPDPILRSESTQMWQEGKVLDKKIFLIQENKFSMNIIHSKGKKKKMYNKQSF